MHQNSNTVTRRSRWYTRLGYCLLLVIMCAVLGEMTVRTFWYYKYHVPFRGVSRVLYAYFPELRKVDTKRPTHSDDIYDILLLGGSALNKYWGTVELELLKQLAFESHRKVRIHNLSKPAHTSRDSWLKYAALGEARFDLVIFYHGINETRANNAPTELFREDYSHYSWYKIVNELAPYHGTNSLALFPTFRYLITHIQQLINKDRYVPMHSPRKEWIHHGGTYRSAASFEKNINAILDLSLQRGDRLLLMTFAIYVPENYSLKAFREKRLDYSRHRTPIEIWGKQRNVIGAVDAHNEIISSVAAKQKDILFVDQAKLMMKGSARLFPYFDDICHFTPIGSSKFVKNLLTVLLPDLKNGGLDPKLNK